MVDLKIKSKAYRKSFNKAAKRAEKNTSNKITIIKK